MTTATSLSAALRLGSALTFVIFAGSAGSPRGLPDETR